MNLLKKIVDWFLNWSVNFNWRVYSYRFIQYEPTEVKRGIVYIVKEELMPDALILKCPCGCASDIHLNVLPDARPCWTFRITKSNRISISPSIRRTIGCRCHFYITEGKTELCNDSIKRRN